MAYSAKKTEHAGAKHAFGAYWGPKRDAKKESNKLRRRLGKRMVKIGTHDIYTRTPLLKII